VLTESELTKLLLANVECDRTIRPDQLAICRMLVRRLAPAIIRIFRSEAHAPRTPSDRE